MGECRCRDCLPNLVGIPHTESPRTAAPPSKGDKPRSPMREAGFIEKANDVIAREVATAIRQERRRCANLVALYPLDGFCYDTNNHGEILRLRDTLSEAILKASPGERIT